MRGRWDATLGWQAGGGPTGSGRSAKLPKTRSVEYCYQNQSRYRQQTSLCLNMLSSWVQDWGRDGGPKGTTRPPSGRSRT